MRLPALVYAGIKNRRRHPTSIPWPEEIGFAKICTTAEQFESAHREASEAHLVVYSVSIGDPYALAQMVHAGVVQMPKRACSGRPKG